MSDATKPGATNEATPEQLAKAQAEGAKAERARVSGIQQCEEAKGRESLASHLAFNTSMSVDEAKAILAVSPKQGEKAAAPAGNPFKEAMDSGEHPNVGADAAAAPEGDKPTGASSILAAARMAGVIGYQPNSKH